MKLAMAICFLLTFTDGDGRLATENNTAITHFAHFSTPLENLVIDRDTGQVYISGRNRLFRLSPELDILEIVITGPIRSNASDTLAIDNINKVLLIDYTNARNRLIACGSINKGSCHVRNLQNISIIEEESQEAVVPENAWLTTVAFIGPGPPPVTNVMYVGADIDNPAVSTRSLQRDRLFEIASSDTRMDFNPTRSTNYVFGFSSEGFSYFLTTNTVFSKLARVCQNDTRYYSYMEMPIECSGLNYIATRAYLGKAGADIAKHFGIAELDDVLYVAFWDVELSLSPEHAICVYSLKSIQQRFEDNIQACFTGNGVLGFNDKAPRHRCVPQSHKSSPKATFFCGYAINIHQDGERPLVAAPIATFKTVVTAVAATHTTEHTIVFAGTLDGHVKKLIFKSPNSTFEYAADIQILHGSWVRGMHFDSQELHLYVMTGEDVFKVWVYDCAMHSTCFGCLNGTDPHCGWCMSEKRCSTRSDCNLAIADPLTWLSGNQSQRCPLIKSVVPYQLQRTTAATLELTIENLPLINGSLLCAFSIVNELTILTTATLSSTGLTCATPRPELLTQIEMGKNNFVSQISVRTPKGPNIVPSVNFTFFDCSTHLSCARCASSQFPCDWCIEAHRCTHDPAENCRSVSLATGIARISHGSGPDSCPRISAPPGGAEILVAHGSKTAIIVQVHGIGEPILQTRLICQFDIEGHETRVHAELFDNFLICDTVEFVYTSNSPNVTVPFDVIWGNSKPLENLSNIHVVIYRCHELCDSCGTCLLLPEQYKCGWCQDTLACAVAKQCNAGWLHRSQTCPNPQIHSFEPHIGPWEGGTNITIRGIDLGKHFSDISVTLGAEGARIPCSSLPDRYVATKKIVCTAGSTGARNNNPRGPIIVQIAGYRAESAADFQFVDPEIYDFQPRLGPISGGTRIRISGNYLNAGNELKAFVGGRPCRISSADEKVVLCRTSQVALPINGKLEMHFDNNVRAVEMAPFRYVADPIIYYAASGSKAGDGKMLNAIPAGGIKITVAGSQFEAVQSAVLVVNLGTKQYNSSVCDVISNAKIECISPKIDLEEFVLDADDPMKLNIEFRLDGWSGTPQTETKLNLYPNPVYYSFQEDVKYFMSEYLTINGKDLNRACTVSDILVKVGDKACNITALSQDQLTCLLKLAATDKNEHLTAVVKIGGERDALNYTIGILAYGTAPNFTWPILLAISLCFLCLISIYTFCCLQNRIKQKLLRELRANFNEGNPDEIRPDLLLNEQGALLPYDQGFEFPRDQLEFGEELGAGAFGIVVKATARGITPNEEETVVAVKLLKNNADHESMRSLISELKILIHLGKHLNVVNLLGAVTRSLNKNELMVIVEYCKFGSLQNILRVHRCHFIDQINQSEDIIDPSISEGAEDPEYQVNSCSYVNSPSGANLTISTTSLVRWSLQVASGMQYLTSRRVLHGDLAARNILLCENNIVKICDFGLSRSIQHDCNYKKKSDTPLPFKWLALEALSDQVFNTYTDVWSFGVLMWELFSLGSAPYPDIEAYVELYSRIRDGYRMARPEAATQEIYELMLACWHVNPKNRPTFLMLEQRLGRITGSEISDEYVQMSRPYLEMNATRFANGETDLLAMIALPATTTPPALAAPPFPISRYINRPITWANVPDDAVEIQSQYEMTAIA